MKSMLVKTAREELITRINALNENSTASWGKMTLYQMLKHCCLAEEMYLGKKKYKRVLLGRVFGKTALKNLVKDTTPLARNIKTSADFMVKGNGDMEEEKKNLVSLIHEYENYPGPGIVHWFFGEMTKEQIGIFSYKHTDHHLRQFNG